MAIGDENGQAVVSNSPSLSKNGSSNGNGKVAAAADPNKAQKYKSLWGKVGKHGMMQAAQAAQAASAAETSSSSSSGAAATRSKKSSRSSKSGWDTVLNPLIQKQRANYSYHAQQHAQQVQRGAAVAGSGWTDANMECDCGEDSCPRCNLLLNMGAGYWNVF